MFSAVDEFKPVVALVEFAAQIAGALPRVAHAREGLVMRPVNREKVARESNATVCKLPWTLRTTRCAEAERSVLVFGQLVRQSFRRRSCLLFAFGAVLCFGDIFLA